MKLKTKRSGLYTSILFTTDADLSELNVILADMQRTEAAKQVHAAWREHTKIVRGNSVRVYEGMEFYIYVN